jgi:hypothetical protein
MMSDPCHVGYAAGALMRHRYDPEGEHHQGDMQATIESRDLDGDCSFSATGHGGAMQSGSHVRSKGAQARGSSTIVFRGGTLALGSLRDFPERAVKRAEPRVTTAA